MDLKPELRARVGDRCLERRRAGGNLHLEHARAAGGGVLEHLLEPGEVREALPAADDEVRRPVLEVAVDVPLSVRLLVVARRVEHDQIRDVLEVERARGLETNERLPDGNYAAAVRNIEAGDLTPASRDC